MVVDISNRVATVPKKLRSETAQTLKNSAGAWRAATPKNGQDLRSRIEQEKTNI